MMITEKLCKRTGGICNAAVIVLIAAALGGCATTFQSAEHSGAQREEKVVAEPQTKKAKNDAQADAAASVASADEARRMAAEAYAAGDLDTALVMFVEAASLDPQDSHSLYAIGAIHENRGNQDQAVRAYRRAVEVNPQHALAQQQLGAAQLRARDLDAAQASLNAALAADPKLWRAHDLLGVIADMHEQHEQAVAHYSSAIALQPSEASIVNNRGYSYYLSGDYDAAEADFRLALKIDQNYGRAWQNLGLVRARQQRYDEARGMMERVVARHVAANDVGYIAMLNGDYPEARALFTNAISLSPRFYPTAVDNLAKLDQRQSSSDLLLVTSEVKDIAELGLDP
jgi:Flp pilus assembly protein TadD